MLKKIALAAALVGIIFYSLSGTRPATDAYAKQLAAFRHQKDRAFRQSPNSPLSAVQKVKFDSLKYYLADTTYFISGQLSRNIRPEVVSIQMSDNTSEKYLRWGEAAFFVPGEPNTASNRLTLFLKANGQDSTLFVPFTDATNGHETYGGGRYLDVPLPAPDATTIQLDFNRAYNPYCAYNDEYSCPVPPAENRLAVAIPAGEKSFHE